MHLLMSKIGIANCQIGIDNYHLSIVIEMNVYQGYLGSYTVRLLFALLVDLHTILETFEETYHQYLLTTIHYAAK